MALRRLIPGLGVWLAAALATPALPAECGLCAKSVVVNSAIATCFLEKYPQLSGRSGDVVVIDMADCAEDERGVVAALRGPHATAAQPHSLRIILSQAQLACLKRKLEEPGLVLDPLATISLEAC